MGFASMDFASMGFGSFSRCHKAVEAKAVNSKEL
jgi:hypothetical protein